MTANCKFRGWKLCATAIASFACGSLVTAHLTHVQGVKADSNRVFELMVYHTEPGKVPALESVFKDVSKLQEKHGLRVVGYWVPNGDAPAAWKDTFVYLVAHASEDDATKNWKALHADPEFLPYRDAAVPLIEKVDGAFQVDEVFMDPTEFSEMK
ncbi:MAG: NIPSNAP family protein [Acidobacteriaceae bacterium]